MSSLLFVIRVHHVLRCEHEPDRWVMRVKARNSVTGSNGRVSKGRRRGREGGQRVSGRCRAGWRVRWCSNIEDIDFLISHVRVCINDTPAPGKTLWRQRHHSCHEDDTEMELRTLLPPNTFWRHEDTDCKSPGRYILVLWITVLHYGRDTKHFGRNSGPSEDIVTPEKTFVCHRWDCHHGKQFSVTTTLKNADIILVQRMVIWSYGGNTDVLVTLEIFWRCIY